MEFNLKLEKIIDEVDKIIGARHIVNILKERELRIYWGTIPGRLPNVNYLIPLMTLRHFIRCGCTVKILFADMHSYLDSLDPDFDVLKARTDIHEKIIKMLLKMMGIEPIEVEFVQGTSYQLTQRFMLDLYKLNSSCTVSQVREAGKLVVRQNNDPKMTSLLYPTLQALDIEYLECDVFFGDTNQEKICHLTNEVLGKLGYKKRGFFLNELYDELAHMKHITFLDTYDKLENKIKNIGINALIVFIDVVIFDLCGIAGLSFTIQENKITTLEEIKKKYELKEINNEDIRIGIINFIDAINKPIREEFLYDESIQLLMEAGYTLKM